MQTIHIVPLSTPRTLTQAAWERLRAADRLFLLSAQHPCARPVLEAGLPHAALDALFDAAEDFDALAAAVAARLLDAGDCTLAVTGAPDALIAALTQAAGGRARLDVLPGVPLGLAAFPERVAARRLCANALPERLDPGEELLLEELDSRLLAGEVKLRLLEYFPDGWEAFVSEMGEDGAFSRRAVPLCGLDRQKRYGPTTVAYVPAAPFEKLERYGFDELLSVLRRLRAPGGCPWDREQTHETIKESLLEECYEAMDAIDRGDDVDLAEELGDVLLQVAFHAEIAREQGRFTARDVTTGLVQKLVYRHPHVFGSVRADTSEQVLKNWDALKKVEKKQQSQADVLESVPKNFPALLRSRKVQKRAAAVGFDWDSAGDAFYKIGEEAEELSRAMAGDGSAAEEVGDLLFAVVNVARLLHIEPEFALAAATDKFIDRFRRMEQAALAAGRRLEDMTLAEQDAVWDEVKCGKPVGKS